MLTRTSDLQCESQRWCRGFDLWLTRHLTWCLRPESQLLEVVLLQWFDRFITSLVCVLTQALKDVCRWGQRDSSNCWLNTFCSDGGIFVFGIIMFRWTTLNLLGCLNIASSLEGNKGHANRPTSGMRADLLVAQTSVNVRQRCFSISPLRRRGGLTRRWGWIFSCSTACLFFTPTCFPH